MLILGLRLAPLLARSSDLFPQLEGGAKLSFGLDAGTFRRVSDAILASCEAPLVINVQRSGSISFCSSNETALEAARKSAAVATRTLLVVSCRAVGPRRWPTPWRRSRSSFTLRSPTSPRAHSRSCRLSRHKRLTLREARTKPVTGSVPRPSRSVGQEPHVL